MKFQDDEPIECYQCNDAVFAGDNYYAFDGKKFCSEECIGHYIIEDKPGFLLENIPGIEKVYLYTAEDHDSIYGDILYDRWKDRQFESEDE